jgi:hypothetical protein
MRFLICAFAALLLLLSRAPAQSAALIGLHLNAWDDEKGMDPPGYRTFLIIFRDGKARLAAEIPDLIVPRKDGFWRVGAVHNGPARDGGFQEFVYVSRAQSIPRALGEYQPPAAGGNCDRTDQATIEFVSPDLLSVSYLHAPGCSLESETQHATYNLDEPARLLDIRAVLGPAAWIALKKADAGAKAAGDFPGECIGASSPTATNWGFERSSRLPNSSRKDWILVGDFSAPHVCNGGDTFEIKSPIPESLIGTHYQTSALLSLASSAAAKEIGINPNEAALTPAGDFLVAFTSSSYGEPIHVFQVNGQSLRAAPALSVSTGTNLSWGFNVVMLQWAIGKHVEKWEADLKAIAAKPLPEPTVAVGKQQD